MTLIVNLVCLAALPLLIRCICGEIVGAYRDAFNRS